MRTQNLAKILVASSAALILFFVGLAWWMRHERELSAAAYFKFALHAARVELPDGATYADLREAYARALASRDPLLGLSGTDPDELRDATMKLVAVQKRLADVQSNETDRVAIAGLYPTDYLLDLASTEEARRAFIRSGSSSDEKAYNAALTRAFRSGSTESDRFNALLGSYATTSMRFPTNAGSMTTDGMAVLMKDVHAGLSRTEDEFKQRMSCLDGNIASCDTRALDLPLPELASSSKDSSDAKSKAQHIRTLYAAATGSQEYTSATAVMLSSSRCIASYVRGPYIFLPLKNPNAPLQFLNDIYFHFVPLLHGGIMQYLHDNLGVTYARINPPIFYICPDTGRDASNVEATLQTVDFARTHPTIAQPKRAPLISSLYVSDDDARAYLRAAMLDANAASDMPRLTEIALMFKEHGAALDHIVRQMVSVNTLDLDEYSEGVPFDLSARTMFLTHGAFPTLFQSYNTSFGSSDLALRFNNRDDIARLQIESPNYWSLHASIPDTKIVHDLHAYVVFERIPN